MLDVSRHFFDVEVVERFIDLLAHHKMNRLHLHLSDDQGWRIQIDSWPRLAGEGGRSQVGGGPGGPLTVTNDAPAVFPLGTTVVTWMVTDGTSYVSVRRTAVSMYM